MDATKAAVEADLGKPAAKVEVDVKRGVIAGLREPAGV